MATLQVLRRCCRHRLPVSSCPGASFGITWAGTCRMTSAPSRANARAIAAIVSTASTINAAVSSSASCGPFWCLFKAGAYACVPQKKPPQPFVCASGTIASLRITDKRAKSDTPFRLFGTGSVGSQVLTGIPRVESIRFDPQFIRCSAVWPFETGWAPATGLWLDSDLRVLHAEIYPSVRAPLPDFINDRGQVRAMWHWARDLDASNLLIKEFAIPPGITSGSQEDAVIRHEEGWILGCSD